MNVRQRDAEPPGDLARDIFLSHSSLDDPFVHRLAADIKKETYQNRNLMTWVDEAEISPGQSLVGMVNDGLERSRFIGIVMTPAYFESTSGWTDAEWHASLYNDPDNRRARMLPILAYDCPYIPFLLRHLRYIDFRGDRYGRGLTELLVVLRDEPLPRPVAVRGQLVAPSGRIDRATLVAERSGMEADPDVITERLYCNLLPVEQLPQYIYTAPIARLWRKIRLDGTEALPTKQTIKDVIREHQISAGQEHPSVPSFRMRGDSIITFHDLESPDGVFAPVIEDESVEVSRTTDWLRDADDRRLVVSLLNMAISRHAMRMGLICDDSKPDRYFFPPKEGGEHVIHWTPLKKKSPRTVAKPCTKDGRIQFWRHQGAYLRMLFLVNKLYLQITPTWVITTDGRQVKGGPDVGRLVINWTGAERNLHVLYHVRFWSTVLRRGPGLLSIRAGDQWLGLATVPAAIQQAYGIAGDQRDLLRLLDQEAALIAEVEDALAEAGVEAVMEGSDETITEGDLLDDWPRDEGDVDAE